MHEKEEKGQIYFPFWEIKSAPFLSFASSRRHKLSDTLLKALAAGGWELPLPAVLTMDGEPLTCKRSLRLLPGKRATLDAHWRGQAVIAKLFLPRAASEQAAEVSGYTALKDAGINTPELLWAGTLDEGISAVVYRRLPAAEPLSAGLAGPRRQAFIAAAFELLAKMHRAGLWQSDIHFDNFLLSGGSLHVIDNASIKRQSAPLPADKAVANLAAFVAQFTWRKRGALLASPALALPLDMDSKLARRTLAQQSRDIWWRRAHKYLEKIFRNCTEVAVAQGGGWYLAHKRTIDPDWIERFRATPDSVIAQGETIKNGNSATVVRSALAGGSVIIKRYNVKSTGHRLRRLFRETRASNAWRAAHLLKMAGIKTPEPLLLLEQRRGPLRCVSYLVSEDVGGEEMLDVYRQREPTEAELGEIADAFRVMAELQLCHGDLKAKNFLVTARGVQLIDLDVLHVAPSARHFVRCQRKDRERFLRNWQGQPGLQQRFRELLGPVEG